MSLPGTYLIIFKLTLMVTLKSIERMRPQKNNQSSVLLPLQPKTNIEGNKNGVLTKKLLLGEDTAMISYRFN